MKRPLPAFLGACAALFLLAAAPAGETRHTVQEGETLNGIANRAGVKASAIAKANGLKPPYPVRVGQVLDIPRETVVETVHMVRAGETLNGIANRAGVTPSALAEANGLKPPYPVRVGQKLAIPGKGGAGADRAAAGTQASPAPAIQAPQADEGYLVTPGETLNGIANRTGVPRSVIAQANNLTKPYVVKVGQKLHIPRQRVHTVAEGDTGFGISFEYGVPYDQILTANGLPKDTVLKPGQKLVIPAMVALPESSTPARTEAVKPPESDFRWPLTGAVLNRFDLQAPGGGHRGIDIEASVGQPVFAARAGQVIFAGEEPVRYGKMVVIEHDGQWYSAYGHLSSISVRKGEKVKAGDTVGHAGSTGVATQPELHFELRQANKPVDPLTKLRPPPAP
ncbi:MAG: LysM peptidoglycan-binding domain-containing M23 family metallopeptidase [Novosphingobium sp.]|nr:LysM peptidoglycan-binding domain-containing M23 family metallopeptidase [Novosphingobium sp.]